MIRITETVKHLLIINVLMFVGTLFVGNGTKFYEWFAMYFPTHDAYKPWQILTHMFMHGNVMHIAFNMLALWMFGSAVEARLGATKFLLLYFSAGLGALAFQLGYTYYEFYDTLDVLIESGFSKSEIMEALKSGYNMYDTRWENVLTENQLNNFVSAFNGLMVGASGCIMGLLVAFGMMFPNAELMLIFLPIPIKAKYFIPGIILLDLFSALTGHSILSPSNTAHMAHVGGAVTGFIIMWYWRRKQFDRYRWN